MTMTLKTQLSATTKDLEDVKARGVPPEEVTPGPPFNEDSAETILTMTMTVTVTVLKRPACPVTHQEDQPATLVVQTDAACLMFPHQRVQ